ncbi:MAG: hypothetical protein ACRDF0_03970 [Candidatus Limnocylindria bacterium]
MSEPLRVRTTNAELTLEEIAESLPGTGDLMALVGGAWWKCWYAAHGGNWPLAAYFARRVRGLQRDLAVIRPKYRADLETFERGELAAVLSAIAAEDLAAFEAAYARATEAANRYHVKTGKAYVRWVLPDEPPKDLHLGPITVVEGEQRT